LPEYFNQVLQSAGLDLGKVKLLRHQDKSSTKGRTPYNLWRDDMEAFEWYQACQRQEHRAHLRAPYWASFVVTPANETLFVGVYQARFLEELKWDTKQPHTDEIDKAGSCDVYETSKMPDFRDQEAQMVVEWGPGARAWIQRADSKNKRIIGVRKEI
jgi:hypothetical protein